MNMSARFYTVLLVLSFMLIGASTSAQSLSVTGTNPAMNAFSVNPASPITITFNSPITGPSANDLYVYSECLGPIAANFSVSGGDLTIQPQQALRHGDVITVGLAQSLQSTAGNTLADPFVFRFTVRSEPSEATPPLFKPYQIPAQGPTNNSRGVLSVDFDGDGDIDVIKAALWLENDGQQHFSPHTFPENLYAFSIAVADIEHDGDMDLLAGTYSGVALVENDGNMSFATRYILQNTIVTNMTIADKNGDGLEDVLCSDQINNTHSLSWLVNNGDGTFAKEVIDNAAYFYEALPLHLDGDNLMDIVAAGQNAVYMFHNAGSSYTKTTLSDIPSALFSAADLDADHDMDLVISGGSRPVHLENTGTGTFATRYLGNDIYSYGTIRGIADLDGDADPDIIVSQGSTLQQYENTGSNVFTKRDMRYIGEDIVGGLSQDLDSDGDIDFIYQLYYGGIGWVKNTTLAEAIPFQSDPLTSALPAEADATAWADYDLDGDQDVLVTSWASLAPVTRLYRKTANNLELAAEFTGVHNGNCAWFDFENDGDPDFMITGRTTVGSAAVKSTTIVYINNGGTFSKLEASSSLPGADGGRVAAADLDNDGRQEIIIAGSQSAVYTFKDDTFKKVFAFESVFQGARLAFGDIDNDGDLDFVATGWRGNEELGVLRTIYKNNGAFNFTVQTKAFNGITAGSLLLEDLDEDGDTDLAAIGTHRSEDGWGNSYSRGSFYKNNSGSFELLQSPQNGPSIYAGSGGTAAGDFNNDGYTDLAVKHDQISVFLNNQAGWFTNPQYEFPGVSSNSGNSVVAVNYDDDQDLDFMVGAAMFRNNTDVQNHKPVPPTTLSDSVRNNFLYTYWTGASDTETPAVALTYQLYAGSSLTSQDLISAAADLSSGKQYIQRQGLARKSWKVKIPTGGDLYWGVQAIDAGIMASAFSAKKTTHVLFISGAQQSCTGMPQKYKVIPSGHYTWTVKGGQVTSSSSDEIEIVWSSEGYGIVSATDGTSKNTLDIRIVTKPEPVISGKELVCEKSTNNIYSTPAVALHTYNWSIEGGSFLKRQDSSRVYVQWGATGAGKIRVFETSAEKVCVIEKALTVTKKILPSPAILGEDKLCPDSRQYTYVNNSDQAGNAMAWTVFGGTVIGSATTREIKVVWQNQAIGRVTVNETNEFCSNTGILEVALTPMEKPDIQGDFIVCGTSNTVTYHTKPLDSYTYQWAVTGGNAIGSLTANQIAVRWQDTPAAKLVLKQFKGNCAAADSVFINVYPPVSKPVIAITSGNVFQAPEGLAYQWNLNGVPLPGATAQSLTVSSAGKYTVTIVNINGCNLTSDELPFPITGIETHNDALPFTLYPNPADDHFFIEIEDNYRGALDVRVYNVIGEVIFTGHETKNEQHFVSKISLSRLPEAFFVVEIRGRNFLNRQKVMTR